MDVDAAADYYAKSLVSAVNKTANALADGDPDEQDVLAATRYHIMSLDFAPAESDPALRERVAAANAQWETWSPLEGPQKEMKARIDAIAWSEM